MRTNAQNTTIVVLLVTAALLTGMLLTSLIGGQEEAYARGTAVKDGNYILGGGLWSGGTELLYIVDIENQKLNVYFTEDTKNTVNLIQTVNLQQAFSE